MKNTLKLALLAGVFVAFCNTVSAQNLKLAHINMQELIVTMPEYDTAMVKLQKFGKDLENEIELLQVEFNRKYDDYLKNRDNQTDLVRRTREEELQQMSQRMQTFQQQAQESYAVEQEKLIQPVVEKANKALETVAKEQGVTYVMSADPQILLFKAIGTLDLLPAVKQHLGIK